MPHSARTRRQNKLSLRRKRRTRVQVAVPLEPQSGLMPQRLSELTGISPAIEAGLYRMGQTRFFQLANWSSEMVSRVADQLGLDAAQIQRANWTGQARRRG